MGVEDYSPETFEISLEVRAPNDPPADDLLKDLRITPIQQHGCIFSAVGRFEEEVLIYVISDENDNMALSSPVFELALKFPGRL